MNELRECDVMTEEDRARTRVERNEADRLRPWRLVDFEGNEVTLNRAQFRAALVILKKLEAMGDERDSVGDDYDDDTLGLASLTLNFGLARSIDVNTGKPYRNHDEVTGSLTFDDEGDPQIWIEADNGCVGIWYAYDVIPDLERILQQW